jgi:hypothetical protein
VTKSQIPQTPPEKQSPKFFKKKKKILTYHQVVDTRHGVRDQIKHDLGFLAIVHGVDQNFQIPRIVDVFVASLKSLERVQVEVRRGREMEGKRERRRKGGGGVREKGKGKREKGKGKREKGKRKREKRKGKRGKREREKERGST